MGLRQSIDALLHRLPTLSRNSPAELAPHLETGRKGESLAAAALKREGYKVLAKNFRGRQGGEIDIVCRHRPTNTLVFVEVKTRRNEEYGRPIDAVDDAKRKRIVKGAMAWLRMLDMPDIRFRFDVVEVVIDEGPEIRIIENAFGLPSGYFY